jgi:hypothetical protein
VAKRSGRVLLESVRRKIRGARSRKPILSAAL